MSSQGRTVSQNPKYAVFGAILGATSLGLVGAAYGTFLHVNPDYRDSLIRKELSRPHPDNPRYIAAIVDLRYQGFTELVIRKSIVPFVIGGLLGAAAGCGFMQLRRRIQVHSSHVMPPRRFTLVELLVVTAIPILEKLTIDTEESVRTAAADALLKLKAVAEPDDAREWPITSEANG